MRDAFLDQLIEINNKKIEELRQDTPDWDYYDGLCRVEQTLTNEKRRPRLQNGCTGAPPSGQRPPYTYKGGAGK